MWFSTEKKQTRNGRNGENANAIQCDADLAYGVAAIRYATVAPVFYVHQRSFISWWKKAPFPLIASFTYQLKVYLFFIINAQRTSYTHSFRHPTTVYISFAAIRCALRLLSIFITFAISVVLFLVLLSYSLPYITLRSFQLKTLLPPAIFHVDQSRTNAWKEQSALDLCRIYASIKKSQWAECSVPNAQLSTILHRYSGWHMFRHKTRAPGYSYDLYVTGVDCVCVHEYSRGRPTQMKVNNAYVPRTISPFVCHVRSARQHIQTIFMN